MNAFVQPGATDRGCTKARALAPPFRCGCVAVGDGFASGAVGVPVVTGSKLT